MIAWMLGPESPRTLALIRLGIGLLVLHDALATWRFSVEMYSSAGPAMPAFSTRPPDSRSESAGPADTSTAPRQQIPGNITGWFVPPPLVAVAAQTLLVFSALAVAVGWKTCPSLLLTMALVAWLRPLDLSWTFAKYTIIWLHMLGLLAWGQSGGMLALDSRQRQPARVNGPALPRRLLQLLACQVYLGAAITKLKSPWFVGGELLQFSLLDRGWGGTWLGHLLATSSLGMRAL
ncbi:MAG: hypothetical protein EHM42_02065, partial [Planctomycetaceae bacterium]